tara:strand:+ start:83 stop:325 length:243 start_codon:yes stop_codon:yes gene_type:complete
MNKYIKLKNKHFKNQNKYILSWGDKINEPLYSRNGNSLQDLQTRIEIIDKYMKVNNDYADYYNNTEIIWNLLFIQDDLFL